MAHYAPFVLVELWACNAAIRITDSRGYNPSLTENELQMLLRVSLVTEIALRPIICSLQIELLRISIKTLQDSVFKERPTIAKCPNVHWLSHLPDDIERYGPVYSWWLFNYERTNFVLKAANSNGHPQDTPLIAYKKLLRLRALDEWTSDKGSGTDAASSYLAKQSQQAFASALSSVNSTVEQKDALSCFEDRENRADFDQRLKPTVVTSQKHVVYPIKATDAGKIRDAWNVESSIIPTVRLHDEHDSTGSLLLNAHATFHTKFRCGRNHFRTPNPDQPVNGLTEKDISKYCGSFFEWRTDGEVLSCGVGRDPVGLLERVFDIGVVGPTKQTVTQTFIKVHMLTPPMQPDPYRFRDRM
ncbi:hypothetical protein QFC24_006792 [Naganishia onofrii]|uniref:Uncharacterized protein n=1 Tax=Naganishia onofrii TaxID=1851511 RepID=A0ACC2WWW9_9TREE|nr:hypothetical protein QFC24_006792 [Naganishia onofrii]